MGCLFAQRVMQTTIQHLRIYLFSFYNLSVKPAEQPCSYAHCHFQSKSQVRATGVSWVQQMSNAVAPPPGPPVFPLLSLLAHIAAVECQL